MDRYPYLKEEVGSSIPGYESPLYVTGELAMWSTILMCFGIGMFAFYLFFYFIFKKRGKKWIELKVSWDDNTHNPIHKKCL